MHLLRVLPRYRRAYLELGPLAARENWSRTEIAAWQLERLNQVWGHAVVHVPHYRRLATEARLPARFSSLHEYSSTVPVLPKSAIKTNPGDFLSERAAPGRWHVSSGSTGSPTRFYVEHDAHREMLRCRYRMQVAWGVDILAPAAFLWSSARALAPGRWPGLAAMRQIATDRMRGRLRLSAYHLSPTDLRAHLDRLKAFQPAMIYAYSTAAYLLAREAEAIQFRPAGLELCVLSAEPAFPHMVTAVERAFGVPAVVEYGATECALIASEDLDRSLRVREDLVLVETRPVEGDRHEILLTVLNNRSFPILRYAIGDLTDRALETPARGFATLSNVAGRSNDLIVARSGRLLHPLRFDFLFGSAMAKPVRHYRIHQRSDGAVSVIVSVTEPVERADVTRLKDELTQLLEGFPITVDIVDALPNLGRKHRWTTSDIVGGPTVLRQTADDLNGAQVGSPG